MLPLLASLLANASAVLVGFVPSASPKSAFPNRFSPRTGSRSTVSRYRNERRSSDAKPIAIARPREGSSIPRQQSPSQDKTSSRQVFRSIHLHRSSYGCSLSGCLIRT